MKCAVIITGGLAPLSIPNFHKLTDYYVIAADSGVDIANILGLKCDLAVGDFDSIENSDLLNDIDCKTYPKDKDYSDTELAIKLAKEKGFEDYILIGGGEGRMDHLFGIWTLFEKYGAPLCWMTRKDTSYLVKNKAIFTTSNGETVSILPTTLNSSSKVNSDDLKWSLKDYPVNNKSFSLSNEAIRGYINIEVKEDPVFISFLTPRENIF